MPQGPLPKGALIRVKSYEAPAYTGALHQMCVACHVSKAKEKNKPEMARCGWCHKEPRDLIDAREVALRRAIELAQVFFCHR